MFSDLWETDLKKAFQEIKTLKAERDAYRDVLKFYASVSNWFYSHEKHGVKFYLTIAKDSEPISYKDEFFAGKTARDVLSRFNNEGKKET